MTTLDELMAEKGWVIADGATGTNYFKLGLETGYPPELWNIERPDDVAGLHSAFIESAHDFRELMAELVGFIKQRGDHQQAPGPPLFEAQRHFLARRAVRQRARPCNVHCRGQPSTTLASVKASRPP